MNKVKSQKPQVVKELKINGTNLSINASQIHERTELLAGSESLLNKNSSAAAINQDSKPPADAIKQD